MTNDIVKSRRGVYYKQDASPYRHTAYGLVFVFSSEAKKRQFFKKIELLREKITSKLLAIYEMLDQDIDIIFFERNTNSLVNLSYSATCLDKLISLKVYKEIEPDWHPLNGRNKTPYVRLAPDGLKDDGLYGIK